MTTLIHALEQAEAGSRELDAEIMSLFYVRDKRHIGAYQENDFVRDEPVDDDVWVDPQTDRWVSTSAYCFTTSIDAAVALAERVLPGWHWGRDSYLHMFIASPNYRYSSRHPVPAIGLVIAILKAKEAHHGE